MKSKAKSLLEYIPFLGKYIDDNVFNYCVERKSEGVTIDHLELHKIIDGVFPGVRNLRMMDKQSQTINSKEVLSLLINTKIIKQDYVIQKYDCDDYAFALKGFFSQKGLSNSTFGIMISRTHAYNFFLDEEKQLWIMEPQSSKVFLAKDYLKNGEEDYRTTDYIL